ncbi:MAG: hypothetical protein JWQ29_1497 [Phenylobacterium sp.]|nr:hypothetical protein [Phenylobacterium sp.]
MADLKSKALPKPKVAPAPKAKAAATPKAAVSTKSRMDKIGVKPGMRAAVMAVVDPTLSAELAGASAIPVTELSDLDLLFYAADSAEELARIEGLVPLLSETGALWVVSRKGKAAAVKDVEVMAAAKAHGLVDNKVVAFSPTHTSLRFVRRKAELQA